jgi:hypothetical protein
MRLPHPDHPEAEPQSVKVYRVIHIIPNSMQYLMDDFDPCDPVMYLPYYMGQYDAKGRLLDGEFDTEGHLNDESKKDPFLYWLLPILRDNPADREHSLIRAYVFRHAGEQAWVSQPDRPKEWLVP